MHPDPNFRPGFCPKKLPEQPQSRQNNTISQSNMQVIHLSLGPVLAASGHALQHASSRVRPQTSQRKRRACLPQRLADTGAKIIGTVHDEIILEVPDTKLRSSEYQKKLKSSGSFAPRTPSQLRCSLWRCGAERLAARADARSQILRGLGDEWKSLPRSFRLLQS